MAVLGPFGLRDFERLRPHELSAQRGLAIFEQHLHDFVQVRAEFVKALTLRVRAGPASKIETSYEPDRTVAER